MGKIPQGILGGISGKVGPTIGGSWKGINYLRSIPISVANPNTVPQQTQRSAMATAVKLAKQILPNFIKPLFDRFAIKQSGYNVWVSENIANCDEDGFVTPANAKMGKGVMSAVAITDIIGNNGANSATVRYSGTLPDNQSANNDVPFVAVYNITDKRFISTTADASDRENGEVEINFSENLATGKSYGYYLVFKSADGKRISNNSYRLDVV